ncbi:unnamed protein product, partial [Brenthis ino]
MRIGQEKLQMKALLEILSSMLDLTATVNAITVARDFVEDYEYDAMPGTKEVKTELDDPVEGTIMKLNP